MCSLYKIHWSNSGSAAVSQVRGNSQVLGLGAVCGSELPLALVSKSWCTFSEHGALATKDRWERAVTLAWTAIAMEMSSKGIQGGIDHGPGKARRSCMRVKRGLRKSSAACSDPILMFNSDVSFKITFTVFNQSNPATLTVNFCHT